MAPTGWTRVLMGAGALASAVLLTCPLAAGAEEAVATAYLDTARLDTARLDGVQHDAVQRDTARLDTARLDAVQRDAGRPTFTVTLSFDDVVDETGALAESGDAPFALTPVFRLGLPRLDPHAAALTSRLGGAPDSSCAGDLCEAVLARMSVAANDNDWRFSLGARANVADRLTSLTGSDGAQPNWYLFVAADAQAMSWNFRARQDSSPVRLDDMRLIGDAQAGVGAHVGGGDLALGYVTREIHHMGAKRQESFVGLTFGWTGQ